MQGLAQQIEQAAAADNFDEATALQAELDSANIETAALASEHDFSAQDAQDLLTAAPSTTTATAVETLKANSTAIRKRGSQDTRSNHSSASSLDRQLHQAAHEPILPEQLIGNGHIPASKAQISGSELSAAVLNQQADQEEEDGEDVDQDGLLVGDSNSVISASHAATDGSRSVQSSRTVLDKMPEFNMDDAVSFR